MSPNPRRTSAAKTIHVAFASVLAFGLATIAVPNAARSQSLDQQIAEEAKKIQAKNAQLIKMNAALAVLRTQKAKNPSAKNWDKLITDMKSKIDKISSDTEMQMLQYRKLVNKRASALKQAKDTIKKNKELQEKIDR